MFFTTLVRTRWPTTSFAFFELANTADVDPAGRVELQCPATGGGFGAAEHDADLLANLVDEDHDRAALGDCGRELAKGLAHESGLETNVRIADFAIEFLLRYECGDRVDDDHVDRVRFDEHLGDLHGFFAAARLADEQHFEIDAELLGPARIEGVFGIDHGGDSAGLLGLSGNMQGERCLAARFGAEDFDHATAWQAATAERHIQRQATGGDAFDRLQLAGERHDRAFAELLFDGSNGLAELGATFEDAGRLGFAAAFDGLLGGFFGFGHTSIGSRLSGGAIVGGSGDHEENPLSSETILAASTR